MPMYFGLSAIGLIILSSATNLTPSLMIIFLLWIFLLTKLTSVSSHLLLVLLMLEFFMLLFLTLLLHLKHNLFTNSNFVLTFFTLAVCEASLGLGLLISVSRKYGSQMLSSFLTFKLNKLLAFKASITLVSSNLV